MEATRFIQIQLAPTMSQMATRHSTQIMGTVIQQMATRHFIQTLLALQMLQTGPHPFIIIPLEITILQMDTRLFKIIQQVVIILQMVPGLGYQFDRRL